MRLRSSYRALNCAGGAYDGPTADSATEDAYHLARDVSSLLTFPFSTAGYLRIGFADITRRGGFLVFSPVGGDCLKEGLETPLSTYQPELGPLRAFFAHEATNLSLVMRQPPTRRGKTVVVWYSSLYSQSQGEAPLLNAKQRDHVNVGFAVPAETPIKGRVLTQPLLDPPPFASLPTRTPNCHCQPLKPAAFRVPRYFTSFSSTTTISPLG